MPWVVFADGLSSEDYLPVLWERREGWAGYKYTQRGHSSLYVMIHAGGGLNYSILCLEYFKKDT